MPPNHDPLEPTPFDVAQPTPASTQDQSPATHRSGPPWVPVALVVLLLLAALVVFWLPNRLAPPDTAAPVVTPPTSSTQQSVTATPGNTRPAANTPESSPWSDAQQARLRKEAQDVLEELLEVQFALEERGVKQWAAARFDEAVAVAAAADELYRDRQFEEATAQYRVSLTAMQTLNDSVPQELERLLNEALQAIENLDPAAANRALDMAALIEPAHTEVDALRQRAQLLPLLLPLLEQAVQAEESDDLATAEQLLQQAVALDPLHQNTQDELQRVATAARNKEFNRKMSEGYAALDEGHFNNARKAFLAAQKIQPDSGEADSALQEVQSAQAAARLSGLRQQGRVNEQQEQWQKAVDTYRQAQKVDSSVLFAAQGLERSTPRAQLDKQLRTVIAEPERLSDARVAANTSVLLQQARGANPRGPVLEKQIDQLDTLLRLANTPVKVTLHSDMETEVVVYKVASLGKFQQRMLTLRPGTYTAVGRRMGYRDIRQTFSVSHERHPQPVTIVCREEI